MTTKTASVEFSIGKHGIGYVDSDFKNAFYSDSFMPHKLGTFKKLGKWMDNADMIEREINPGKCDLGDVLAFLENPPEGTKDGWANLFLIEDKVVSVRWGAGRGSWYVHAWDRGRGWDGGGRVFSPGLEARSLGSEPSVPATLESLDPQILSAILIQLTRIADALEKPKKVIRKGNREIKID